MSLGSRFCDGCGRPRTEPAQRAGRDVASYTPRHLADRILNHRFALEGERKQVTVLFVDIQSSVELAESTDPEEWHRTLDRFFTVLADGVHRFEGTVNQYTGDGVMALFGAPIAHEDHAQRACYAALHLSRELRRYAQQLRREQGLDFRVRMGLNSGEVVVGRIGDDLRMDYTAQGHTVSLAARMEQLAEAGKVYLTADTAALVSGFFELEDLGDFKLQGIRQSVHAYALEGEGNLRTRLDLARSRGFSRFVGREREMQRLEAALEQVRGHGGRAIGIVSQAGIGKSRLCHEFAEGCRARGIGVVAGYGSAHGRALPFRPILELLREAFEIEEHDETARARRKIAGALLLVDRDIADDLPLIFDFLGVEDPDEPAPLVEGEGRQRRIYAILHRFLQARSATDPVVLLLEDLHWFDRASLGFVQSLVEGIENTHALLVLNHRSEFQGDWAERSAFEQISLEPLGERAVDAMLDDLLGRHESLAKLIPRIRKSASGNPFFIEEVVQSLVEGGELAGHRGAHRLLRPLGELHIPSTVHTLIASRIDRLGEHEKQLLETAAVIGKRSPADVLRSVSPLPAEAFERSLRALLDSELLLEESLQPPVYAFKHPLTQEVAYQSQLSDHRRGVHARVARALEDALDTEESAPLVAHHWEQSGNALAAARWLHRAARWIGPSDPAEAMSLWRRLVEQLQRAPRSAEIAFLGARACRWLLFLGASQGMPEQEATALFRAGVEYSKLTRDRRSQVLTACNYGYYRAQIAVDAKSAVEHARGALEVAQESGRAELELLVGIRLVQALAFWGRFDEAATLGAKLVTRIEAEDAPRIDPLDHVTLFSTLGDALNELGRPEQGIHWIERGLRLATERDLTLNAGYCHNAYVRHLALTGSREKAEHHALAAMRAAERTGNTAMQVYAYDVLGLAHQLNRRWEEAVASGEQAIELSRRSGVARISENAHRAHLAYAYLFAGDPSRALSMGEQAVEASARCGPRYTPRAHLALARALIESQGLRARKRIETNLELAQAAVDQTGARIYEPVLLEDRAQLAALAGQTEAQRLLLGEAHDRYLAMQLPWRAERIRELLDG